MILAIDQGSSSSRCVAFDRDMRELVTASRTLSTVRPAPGMVEHDPAELLRGVIEVLGEAHAASGEPPRAVAIANQTESFVLWDRRTGDAVTPVVSWQDTRATELCDRLAASPGAVRVEEATGLGFDPTFTAPKVAWLFERDPELRRRADAGELLLGDVACWLCWHLSGGAAHVTEPSNACRTLVYDTREFAWDDGLLDLFGIPAGLLPQVRPSDGIGAQTSAAVAGFEAPVVACLGDQPAALFGQGCTSPGLAALTLGTGAFVWQHAGGDRPAAPEGVLATVAWDRRGARAHALEAFGANAGNALSLLRSSGLVAADWRPQAPRWGEPHPVVVPAPAGLGTPHWVAGDRVTMLAASAEATPEGIAAGWVAGVAHQVVDALEAVDPSSVRVGGGLARDEALLQAVADLWGRPLEVSSHLEATARGVARLAGEAAGLLEADAGGYRAGGEVAPKLDEVGRHRERGRWREALDAHRAAGAGV